MMSRLTRLFCSLLILVLSNQLLFGQATTPADTSYWSKGAKGILTFTQASYSNWVAGGENSIAMNAFLGLNADYNKDRTSWSNLLEMGYGFSDFESQGVRKSDDKILYITNFAYKLKTTTGKLFWSTSVSFLSQFTDGFAYPNDTVKISTWLAPGYVNLNTGLEFKREKWLSIIYSPIGAKWTIVTDDVLAAAGAFGVDPGENIRTEIGTSLTAFYKKDIAKNVNLDTKARLFTNYQESFGNIDINWETIILFKVNEVLSSNLLFHVIYDDDIDIQEFDDNGALVGEGPRTQFKQLFGLGLNFTL